MIYTSNSKLAESNESLCKQKHKRIQLNNEKTILDSERSDEFFVFTMMVY